MSVSAPAASASAATVCIFRTLLPPRPNDSRSSRFMKSCGVASPNAASRRVNRSIGVACGASETEDRKSTRLNSSHGYISYAVFCLKKKNIQMCNHDDGQKNISTDDDTILHINV